jgi:ketosteroid isomerase-like protein
VTPPRTPEQVLRRYQKALIDQNADDLADLYAPDAVHELPFLFPGMPARYEGSDQVRAAYDAAWRATDARPREVRTVGVHHTEDPEVVIAEQVVVGVNASTREPFELPGVLVLRVQEGRITHVRDYMDGLAVARAMRRLRAVVEALASP